MEHTNPAARFVSSLQLQHRPVGLAFVDQVPEQVKHVASRVPSACTFWRLAEQGVFYATAEDHQECPIGMLTMGFKMPASAQQRAQDLVQTMASVNYFSPSEVNALPVVKKAHSSIIYGPVEELPVEADVVLCILNTQQAMLVAEALGDVSWLQHGQTAFGRPTCGVIPRTWQSGESSVSFGCVGARTYVGLTPGEVVMTLLATSFDELVEKIETIIQANAALAPYHQQQKATFGV
ncbi:DUF169 domain-containing protein [Tengunoibacter tsumagoiensis]|uniref:DUF169 domain-containing protein n=1 Tax=Tengunoibacter tsumagoiensis TaxID=2014871 RepID=A0A401ZZN8_9CHLR|nr:DUF169 domain-containing protein [Tengunoibacter tsumagoiensis]GCE12340.1 hypothetical protein KTT_21990 [Tengunoibacter tsumagoiensis]